MLLGTQLLHYGEMIKWVDLLIKHQFKSTFNLPQVIINQHQ